MFPAPSLLSLTADNNVYRQHCLSMPLEGVVFPLPDDPRQELAWENYVTAQMAGASLGLIPAHGVALGIRVDGYNLNVVCQLTTLTADDLDEIQGELHALIADSRVRITWSCHVRERPDLSPTDGTRWIYAARD